MNDDELRARLRRIDPAPSAVPMDPPTSPSARARLERIMTTTEPRDPSVDTPPSPVRRTPPARWLLAGAAALIVVAGVAIGLAAGGDDDDVAAAPLELSLGGDDALASCLALDPAILADMPTAFAGTATAIEGDTVTLDVERWYTGGDAETVVLQAPTGQAPLIAGFEFETDQEYLVSATGGAVNFCGYSGPATAELTAVYDQAFPG